MLAATSRVIGAALLAGWLSTGSASAAPGPNTLTAYSIATHQQFVNNNDDRIRAVGDNPVGDTDVDLPPKGNRGGLAGDLTLFTFDVYVNADLKRKLGTAVLTCHYGFEQSVFCTASYALNGGTLFAAGTFDFDTRVVTLAVTGGTGRYSRMTGVLRVSPGARHTQRLRFSIAAP